MSTFTHLTVLALASAVLATPPAYGAHKHGHGHSHLHGTGAATGFFPYPTANGTGVWGSTGINKPAGYGTATKEATTFQTVPSYRTVTVNRNYAQESAPASAIQSAPAYDSSAAPSAPAADADAESCAAVVTVTNTERVTLTVTEGGAASTTASSAPVFSAPAYSSASVSEASPVESSSAPAYSAPAYSAPAYSGPAYSAPAYSAPAYNVPANSAPAYSAPISSSEASPAKSTAPSAPAYSASSASSASASSSAAPILSQYGLANKGVVAQTATASAPATYSSTSSSSSGKRGLAYNDASLATCFSGGSQISWAYNWGSSKGDLAGDYSFIPTLWGTGSDFTGSWSENAKSAISAGSTHLFSFNEPDHSAQANLAPAAAATAYAQYMSPFAGQAKLCAPAVTNGGGDMGLTWLKSFLDACTDCTIDCLNIHWYDAASNSAYFKSHIEEAIELANGKPIYVSEFGATGSNDEINSFLQEVMPWMDSNDRVAGYAYFMVKDGLLVSGTEPSTYGSTYMSYTS